MELFKMGLVFLYQMGTYVLGFIDYHWNISEHYVLGKHGDLEAQLHHYDLSYGTYEEAVEVPGAVLSIALLFKVKKGLHVELNMWEDVCFTANSLFHRATRPSPTLTTGCFPTPS